MTLLFSFPWSNIVKSRSQYQALTNDTWILTFIAIGLAVLLTWLIAGRLIGWQADNRDFAKRKITAILVGALFALGLCLYNFLFVSGFISAKGLLMKFSAISQFGTIWQSLLTFIIVYTLLLFVIAKVSPNGRMNSIFAKRR